MIKFVVGVLALFSVALAVYLYTDVPTTVTVAEPWKVRQMAAVERFVGLVAGVAEFCHISSRISTSRTLNSWLLYTGSDSRVKVSDATFGGVSVRMYQPIEEGHGDPRAGVLYIPGGGWVYNDLDQYNGLTSYLAAEANVVVVSIGYRSAPEHLFPVAFDDSVTGVVHFLRNADKYGVDPKRVAIAGDDSGGNLAAAVANRLTFESTLPPIKLHALFYPLLQSFDFNLPSYTTHDLSFIMSRSEIISRWLHYYQGHDDNLAEFLVNNHTDSLMKSSEYAEYVKTTLLPPQYHFTDDTKIHSTGNTTLAEIFEKTLLNPYFCPLMASEFATLPPAYVVTVEFDPARDDGLLYVQRSRDAGVNVVHKHVHVAVRGFLQTIGGWWEQSLAKEATDDFVKYIRANL